MSSMLHTVSLSWVGASLLAATLSLLLFLRWTAAKKPGQLPTPPRLPIIGNLHQLGSLAHHSLARLSEKYGPVMLLHFGRVPTVVVSSAAGAQEALKTRDLAFSGRPLSSLSDRLFYDSQDVAFAQYGGKWRQMRRVCVLHLLSPKQVRSFRSVREEEVARLVDCIRAATGAAVNMSAMIIALTCDILCKVAFGSKYTEEGGSQIHSLMSELSAVMGMFPLRDHIPWLGWIDWLNGMDGRVKKIAMTIDSFIEKVLEEHTSKRSGNNNDEEDCSMDDLVDILISLGDKEDLDVMSLGRDSIKAIILDMFAAGTETTYVAMEWAMAELMKHPAEMKRAQEEVRRVVGPRGNLGEEAAKEMQYLKAVIKETLRLHPPFPILFPRQTVEDTQLLGYHVPQGTTLFINAWALGRDVGTWEQPEEFRPERFIGNDIDFKGQDFQLIPFGAGRRGCPGIDFAVATVEIALASLLYHFDWELPEGMRVEEMDMSESTGITVRKKSSLIIVGKTVSQ
ncbi:unnamed protein product [Musa textilis]